MTGTRLTLLPEITEKQDNIYETMGFKLLYISNKGLYSLRGNTSPTIATALCLETLTQLQSMEKEPRLNPSYSLEGRDDSGSPERIRWLEFRGWSTRDE